MIIGVIYKPPNFNLNEFIDSLCTTLSKVESEQKDCYLLGDYNFDLLKYSTHGDTEKLLSTLNTYCYRPLITKPTRVTAHSCTCIDNIFSNVLSELILPGVRLSSLFWLETTFETTFRVIWEMINAKLF